MDIQQVTALYRVETGKTEARRFRSEDKIPGVLYGAGMDPVPLVLDRADLSRILHHGRSDHPLVDIKVGGDRTEECRGLLRDLQVHPVSGRYLHVDFQMIRMDQKLTIDVPVVLEGEPEGVKVQGGILEQSVRNLNISCLPDQIPEAVVIDVSALTLNSSIHLEEIIPDFPGVDFLDDPSRSLATVVAPAKLAALVAEGEAAVGEKEEEEEAKEAPADEQGKEKEPSAEGEK